VFGQTGIPTNEAPQTRECGTSARHFLASRSVLRHSKVHLVQYDIHSLAWLRGTSFYINVRKFMRRPPFSRRTGPYCV